MAIPYFRFGLLALLMSGKARSQIIGATSSSVKVAVGAQEDTGVSLQTGADECGIWFETDYSDFAFSLDLTAGCV
jgi:hypothetical protein